MKRPLRAVYYSTHFARQYRRLPLFVKQLEERKEALFRADAFDPCLRTHKLKGKLATAVATRGVSLDVGRQAYSVTSDVRIVFRFLDGDEVLLLAVGAHETVY